MNESTSPHSLHVGILILLIGAGSLRLGPTKTHVVGALSFRSLDSSTGGPGAFLSIVTTGSSGWPTVYDSLFDASVAFKLQNYAYEHGSSPVVNLLAGSTFPDARLRTLFQVKASSWSPEDIALCVRLGTFLITSLVSGQTSVSKLQMID
jgi:hypothetical protein